MIKDFLKNAALLAAGCLAALLLLEGFLAFYGPLKSRVRGGEVILFPYKRYVVENTKFPKLEKHIVRSNNSLGFRGPEPLAAGTTALTLIAVGGSTTECFYLSDGKSWPELLQKKLEAAFTTVWVNNAGMDGHSTFGHAALLSSYIVRLKPKAVVFLAGLNDMGLASASRFDRLLTENAGRPLPARAFVWAAARSRTAALLQNMLMYSRAIKAGLVHAELDLKAAPSEDVSPAEIKAMLAAHAAGAAAYGRRLEGLVRTCRANGIEPVLATQPLLCGQGKDPVTGADLERLHVDGGFRNCRAQWAVLELYNDEARRKAKALGVPLADLAREIPKDSTYYYDTAHFTEKGADMVAERIYLDVCGPLARKFPQAYRGSCPDGGK